MINYHKKPNVTHSMKPGKMFGKERTHPEVKAQQRRRGARRSSSRKSQSQAIFRKTHGFDLLQVSSRSLVIDNIGGVKKHHAKKKNEKKSFGRVHCHCHGKLLSSFPVPPLLPTSLISTTTSVQFMKIRFLTTNFASRRRWSSRFAAWCWKTATMTPKKRLKQK